MPTRVSETKEMNVWYENACVMCPNLRQVWSSMKQDIELKPQDEWALTRGNHRGIACARASEL